MIHKYTPDEARNLKTYGELKTDFQINENVEGAGEFWVYRVNHGKDRRSWRFVRLWVTVLCSRQYLDGHEGKDGVHPATLPWGGSGAVAPMALLPPAWVWPWLDLFPRTGRGLYGRNPSSHTPGEGSDDDEGGIEFEAAEIDDI